MNRLLNQPRIWPRVLSRTYALLGTEGLRMTLAGLVLAGSLLSTAPAQKVAQEAAHEAALQAAQQAEAMLNTVKPAAPAWHMAAGVFAHWSKKPQVSTALPAANTTIMLEQDQKPS